jgi:hypothetical protein
MRGFLYNMLEFIGVRYEITDALSITHVRQMFKY